MVKENMNLSAFSIEQQARALLTSKTSSVWRMLLPRTVTFWSFMRKTSTETAESAAPALSDAAIAALVSIWAARRNPLKVTPLETRAS